MKIKRKNGAVSQSGIHAKGYMRTTSEETIKETNIDKISKNNKTRERKIIQEPGCYKGNALVLDKKTTRRGRKVELKNEP